MKRSLTAAAFAAALAAQPAAALTVGDYSGANCIPFSCMASYSASGIWQQVYKADNFSGPITIGGINVFREFSGSLDTASLSLAWYISATAYGASLTVMADNLGTQLSDWGAVSFGGVMPEALTISGPAFTYDPSDGDLLLHVEVLSFTSSPASRAPLKSASSTAQVYRNYDIGGAAANGSQGLVTEFLSAAVPLPAAAPLLLGGLALIAGVARRRAA